MKKCANAWQLHVDNDIYITGADWYESLASEIEKASALDCDIVAPLLYNVHDRNLSNRLYVNIEKENLPITTLPPDQVISNIFPGGAAVIRRNLFVSRPNFFSKEVVSGYDERLFVGFEDFDYSISRIENGVPLRVLSTDVVGLAHAHVYSPSKEDQATVRARYSETVIEKAARVIEGKRKNGKHNGWKEWILEQAQIMIQHPYYANIKLDVPERPRLCVVLDTRGWAFENILSNIMDALTEKYEVVVIYHEDYPSWAHVISAVLTKKPDLVHLFWRPILEAFGNSDWVAVVCEKNGMRPEEAIRDVAKITWSTCIYDHLWEDTPEKQRPWLHFVDDYYVSSETLYEIYSKSRNVFPRPSSVIPDGVDMEVYKPKGLNRFDDLDRPLTIGWVGNSLWGDHENLDDIKGLRSIVRPAIKLLEADNIPFNMMILDSSVEKRSREEVCSAYGVMDILLCTSRFEGTPNPVLEAISSGVPIVSTDVGIVRTSLGERQREFIVERSPEHFFNAIKRLHENRILLKNLSEENISQRTKISWGSRGTLWQRYFDELLSKRKNSDIYGKLSMLTGLIYKDYSWVDISAQGKTDCRLLPNALTAPMLGRLSKSYRSNVMAPIVVASPTGRTGVNVMCSMLSSHPNSVVSNQIHSLQLEAKNAGLSKEDFPTYIHDHLGTYLDEKDDRQRILKLVYPSLLEHKNTLKVLLSYELPVLCLDRKNTLAVAVSYLRAGMIAKISKSRTGSPLWTARTIDDIPGTEKIDIGELEKIYLRLVRRREEFLHHFHGSAGRRLVLEYDLWEADPERYRHLIEDFVGQPLNVTKAQFVKATPRNFMDVIANSSEVLDWANTKNISDFLPNREVS
tara:strand:+ start:1596 stop:4160 length:2565 start_codon:yes stop_codon:yes gene_type:complete